MRIVNSRSTRVNSTTGKTSISSSTRADKTMVENQIANNHKEYYTQFLKMVSAPSVLCTYFSINKTYTNYSESTKNIKDNFQAKYFDMIKNFVLYERDSEDIEDVTDSERRLSINLNSKTSFIQPGVILPKEGDHLVLSSQGKIAKPYQVTKVTPRKFLDKEIWEVQYSESTVFTLDELIQRVVRKRVYIANNVGTDSAVIVDEELSEKTALAAEIIDKLNKKYIESFYDEKYDQLVFKPHGYENEMHFNYYANDRMQESLGLLKYGFDKNTLFITNIYKYDAVEMNYDASLYTQLQEKWFQKRECYEAPDNAGSYIKTEAGEVLSNALNLREMIYAEYRGIGKHSSKYIYNVHLYLRSSPVHSVLTRYYNSKITLVDMFDSAGFYDPKLKQCWIDFNIENPYITRFLDMYMDGDYEKMIGEIGILKRYNPSKFCIDDYLGVPLLMIAISNAIDNINKKSDYGTYI